MKHVLYTSAFASLLCLAGCADQPSEPTLIVADHLTWKDVPTIKAAGLNPGEIYTLDLARRSSWNDSASELSSLTYLADAKGRIDTSAQTAEGDYEPSAYVPFRTMKYVREPLGGVAKGRLRLRLLGGDGKVLDEGVVKIGPDRALLIEESFDEDFSGAFILKRKDAAGRQPALILLGGSEGGDGAARSGAPNIALEGFTVLGLPYYSPAWNGRDAQFPDLPRDFLDIPVDYLEAAVMALRKRDDVDPDRILLRGGSKGAEFVLLASALIPDDSPGGGFCAIVADVPTDVVWEGWGQGVVSGTRSSFSWRGEALPFVPYKDMGRVFAGDANYTMTEAHENGRNENPERAAAARIKIEIIDEPVMLIGGDKDTTWASGPMSRTVKAARDVAGLETEIYAYADGSHAVGSTPFRRGNFADNQARIENYPAMINFLKRHAKRDDCR